MARVNALHQAFNRGLISRLALARTDLDRTRLAAEVMTNWMPRTLGSMMLRPGTQDIAMTRDNLRARYIPFVFAVGDTALIELTDEVMRVLVDDALVTRPAVTATITNGDFDPGISGWTNSSDLGGTIYSVGNAYGTHLGLEGNNVDFGRAYQLITCNEPNVQHSLKLDISLGPVTVKVGSTLGGYDYMSYTLGAGMHSLTFTPSGDFYIQFESSVSYIALVDSVSFDTAGPLEIETPWGEDNLPDIRFDQSGDVIYVACKGLRQRKIERRDGNSWSVTDFAPADGPFLVQNVGPTTISSSAINGIVSLTSNKPLFRPEHAEGLFRILSVGQVVTQSLTGANQFSNEIRVTGISADRNFTIEITGTWSATITLQRSVGSPGAWVDVQTYTVNQSITFNDGFDNSIIYYRIGIKTGDYTSGTADVTLTYASGSIPGIVRLLPGFVDEFTAVAWVLKDLGGTQASADWSEGAWSTLRGFPSSVAFHEGRLWWAGKDKIFGSVSDAFESYDDEVIGDAGPIQRSIGFGPVDTIQWLLSLQRLLLGGEGAEFSARSSSLDEPLTPTDFQIKAANRQGSAGVQAVPIDSAGVFVQRGKARVYMLSYGSDDSGYDYGGTDLTALVPELCAVGIVSIAVQRQPDTRIHCVLGDGSVAILIFDKNENITCWVKYETDGLVEDVSILPEADRIEDSVYYVVKRSDTSRRLEKWAMESECRGGSLCKLADSHVIYSGSSATVIPGLSHLNGKEVVAWGNGKDLGTYTVSGGQITLSEAVTSACIGLPYTAQYKSTKLAYGLEGTALNQKKRVHSIGLILADCHHNGLLYGYSFDDLDPLPEVEDGAVVAADIIWESYDKESFEFDGTWDTDSRVCLEANAPRPCTVLSLVIGLNANEK